MREAGLFPVASIARVRSKSGCRTCRTRRVKCGEERPECRRCLSTGRKCDYLARISPFPTPRPSPLDVSPVQRERRAFQYYYYRAAPALSDALDLPFWRGAVLQISRSEPAVWDAVVALSTFFRFPLSLPTGLPRSTGDESRSRSQQEGLSWYSRSLVSIQTQILRGRADLVVALVSCILFVCIEILQGNVEAVMTLYRQGMQLIVSDPNDRSRCSVPLRLAAGVLKRLSPLAQMMGGLARLSDHLDQGTVLDNIRDVHVSLGAARDTLYSLVTKWKKLDEEWKIVRRHAATRQAPEIGDTFYSRQSSLEHEFVIWYQRFKCMDEVARYLDRSGSMPDIPKNDGIIASLLMTYTAFLLSTRTCLALTESVYEDYEAEFSQIVVHAPVALAATVIEDGFQPPFAFDMGIAMPLFVTALKCRLPALRRQALELQLRGPSRQSLYVGASAAQLLAAVIALEEAGNISAEIGVADVLSHPGCVPSEESRVVDFSLVSDGAFNGIKFSRWNGSGDKRRLVNQVVRLPSQALAH